MVVRCWRILVNTPGVWLALVILLPGCRGDSRLYNHWLVGGLCIMNSHSEACIFYAFGKFLAGKRSRVVCFFEGFDFYRISSLTPFCGLGRIEKYFYVAASYLIRTFYRILPSLCPVLVLFRVTGKEEDGVNKLTTYKSWIFCPNGLGTRTEDLYLLATSSFIPPPTITFLFLPGVDSGPSNQVPCLVSFFLVHNNHHH